jgi:hypothetical protein
VFTIGSSLSPDTTFETYKVVYVQTREAAVDPTVCLLQLRSRLEHTRVFLNDLEAVEPLTSAALSRLEQGAHPGRQYVLDGAVVVAAHFIGERDVTVAGAVGAYRRGEARLVSQISIQNRLPLREGAPFYYEVGETVVEPNAGCPGMNGCKQGIHVFASKADAVQHALLMSVTKEGLVDVTDAVCVPASRDDLSAEDLLTAWWPWNVVGADPHATCASCGAPPLMSFRGAPRQMGCGHRVCHSCARLMREVSTSKCAACDVPVDRIECYAW